MTPLLGQGQRVDSVEGAQPSIGDTLDRAQGFLLLAGSLAVVLAAAAITLASRRFGERHTQYVAILKSLGAQSHEIARLYGRSLFWIGLMGTIAGCALGWALQETFIRVLGTLLPVEPGAAGGKPVLIGGVTAAVCLIFLPGRHFDASARPRRFACCVLTLVSPKRSVSATFSWVVWPLWD